MYLAAVLLTVQLAASIATPSAEQHICPSPITCPCGITGRNIRVCLPPHSTEIEYCKQWSRCKNCREGLHGCSECEEGYEGTLCTLRKRERRISRQKRQYYRVYGRSPQNVQMQRSYCPNLDSPKLGSIRCISTDQLRTCVGKCLPGYSFENRESTSEITLTCQGGGWSPMRSFPPCKSGGHCDLIVHGAGSFNCTTGMSGTRCDVICANRYAGRFLCYPGRNWEPPLPYCVRAKGVVEDRPSCRCQYGASCDRSGSCVCPVGRTGTYCETIVPDKQTCHDPGFVSNGFRRFPDGTESNSRRTFEEGDSVVFGCRSEEFALQGSPLITCRSDGRWSSPLPKCIIPISRFDCVPLAAEPAVTCPDPGQVDNADRLNSDGSSSVGVQRYEVGQSVVFSCHQGFALQRRSGAFALLVVINCLDTGSWSDRTPHCTRVIPAPSPVVRPSPPANQGGASGLKYCRDPGIDPNGSRKPSFSPSRRGFPQGSRLEYSCNQGYDLSGERSVFCETSGEWSATRPRCEAQSRTPDVSEIAYCLNPGTITNGRVVYYPLISNRRRGEPQVDNSDPEYPEGGRLQYSCDSGYSLVGASTLICEQTGFWSADAPTCRRDSRAPVYCLSPGPISNGRVVHIPSLNERRRQPLDDDAEEDMEVEYPEGSRLQYTCNSDYTLEGSATIACQSTGSWSADPPKCLGVTTSNIMFCDNPGTIFNGRIKVVAAVGRPRSGTVRLSEDDIDFPEGTRLEYSCDDGFVLQGTYLLRCQSTGYWSADPPTCQGDCGRSFMQTSRRVLHGIKTVSGEWPWVVAISVQEEDFSRIVCGGALVNSRTVMTAAHCLAVADRFTLYFGKLYRSVQADDSQVMVRRSTRVIKHPDFTNSTLDSDIGLVMFEPRIRFSVRVQPVCLPTAESTAKNLMTGKTGHVTGWGYTERNLPADELLLASLPILTNEACLDSYAKQNISLPLTRNMFCAGFPTSQQQSVCSGDSGSPLVFYDRQTERYTVEGLVSFGVEGQCGLAGRYTIFTKVFRYLPWILRNL